jgi:hypothetical protein
MSTTTRLDVEWTENHFRAEGTRSCDGLATAIRVRASMCASTLKESRVPFKSLFSITPLPYAMQWTALYSYAPQLLRSVGRSRFERISTVARARREVSGRHARPERASASEDVPGPRGQEVPLMLYAFRGAAQRCGACAF